MAGVITTKHLITEARAIIVGFGIRTYVRCWAAVLSGGKHTFLSLVWS